MTYGGGAQTRDELDPGDGWHWKDDWKLSQTALDVYVTPERRQGMPTRLLFHFRVGTLAYDCLSSLASFSSSSFPPIHDSNEDGWQYAANRQSAFKRSTRNAELRRRLWERTAVTSLQEQSSPTKPAKSSATPDESSTC